MDFSIGTKTDLKNLMNLHFCIRNYKCYSTKHKIISRHKYKIAINGRKKKNDHTIASFFK